MDIDWLSEPKPVQSSISSILRLNYTFISSPRQRGGVGGTRYPTAWRPVETACFLWCIIIPHHISLHHITSKFANTFYYTLLTFISIHYCKYHCGKQVLQVPSHYFRWQPPPCSPWTWQCSPGSPTAQQIAEKCRIWKWLRFFWFEKRCSRASFITFPWFFRIGFVLTRCPFHIGSRSEVTSLLRYHQSSLVQRGTWAFRDESVPRPTITFLECYPHYFNKVMS